MHRESSGPQHFPLYWNMRAFLCQRKEFTRRMFLENAAPIPLVSSQVTQEEIIDDGQAERDGRSLLAHKFPMEAVARHSHGGKRNSHAGHSSRRRPGSGKRNPIMIYLHCITH